MGKNPLSYVREYITLSLNNIKRSYIYKSIRSIHSMCALDCITILILCTAHFA